MGDLCLIQSPVVDQCNKIILQLEQILRYINKKKGLPVNELTKEQDCFVNASSNIVCSCARSAYCLAGNSVPDSTMLYCGKKKPKQPKINILVFKNKN